MNRITIDEIRAAEARLKPYIKHTLLEQSVSVSQRLGTESFLKFENQQTTGSFKVRGALNKILSLSDADRKKGIIAASAGNHAQGVAFAAREMKTPATIVMPLSSPIAKVEATKGYGAQVILHGQFYDESYAFACKMASERGEVFVHPFADPLIMAGQGTVGLEILKDLPAVDSVLVPIGGGGLISGVAVAIKSLRPSCRVYGVVAENAPGMSRLYKSQTYSLDQVRATIADGIAVKKPSSEIMETYLAPLVDDIVEVSDDEIAEAIVFLLERAKALVEGSGAVVLAAANKGGLNLGSQTCLLLSGGNIDLNLLAQVIEKGLATSGRLVRITVVVDDRPGVLHELTGVFSRLRANILQVHHDRLDPRLQVRETSVDFLIETRGPGHLAEIQKELRAAGARINVL